jgi:hypothetical protein
MAFLALLAIMLVMRLLTGEISIGGLLLRKDGSGEVSPERVQLLITTVTVSAKYLGEALHGSGNSLPDVGPQLLCVFGASSGIYASVKAVTTFRKGA